VLLTLLWVALHPFRLQSKLAAPENILKATRLGFAVALLVAAVALDVRLQLYPQDALGIIACLVGAAAGVALFLWELFSKDVAKYPLGWGLATAAGAGAGLSLAAIVIGFAGKSNTQAAAALGWGSIALLIFYLSARFFFGDSR
jgi:hypothetical protein